jgi:hypothetical protein
VTSDALFQKELQGIAVDLVEGGGFLPEEKGEKEIDISLVGLNGIVGKSFFSD